MTLKQFFAKQYEIPANLTVEYILVEIIKQIETKWAIQTTKSELLVDIKQAKLINPITKEWEIHYFVVVKPSTELLKKFAVDYPHLVI